MPSASRQTASAWEIEAGQLADIEYDLTPKRRDRSGLDRFSARCPPPYNVLPLEASTSSGRAIRARDLHDAPPWNYSRRRRRAPEDAGPERLPFVEWIPYIRIKDVQTSDISRGSAWLAVDPPIRRKPAGDCAPATSCCPSPARSARPGWSAMARSAAVAAGGFFVLRPTAIRWIRTICWPICNVPNAGHGWTTAPAAMTRATFRCVLKDSPVPVPPLPIQQRAAEQHRQFGVDVLSYLAELLSEDRGEPLAAP